MKSTGRRIAVAVLTPIVLFTVAEIATRSCGVLPSDPLRTMPNIALVPDALGDEPAPMRRHPTRFFEPTPDLPGLFATDSNAFRGGPHPKTHARMFRVAVVGDSVAMGFGVRYGASIAGRIESALRRELPSLDVDVVDAGCAGYTTWQNRIDLEERVLPMVPDWVVLAITAWNDTRGAVLHDDVAWAALLADAEHGSLLARSRAMTGLSRLLSRCGVGMSEQTIHEHEAAVARGESPDGPRVSHLQFLENVSYMIERCRARGVRPIVVLLPRTAASDAENPEPLRYMNDLAAAVKTLRVPSIDAAPLFPALDGSMFFDHVHPNEDGHALIAAELVKVFLDDASFDLRGWSARAATTRPELSGIAPPAASAFGDVPAVVKGAGFKASTPPRFFIGGDPLPVIAIVDDTTARVRIPPLAPGAQDVEVQTERGSARLEHGFNAIGPALRIDRNPNAARIVVTSRPGDRMRIQCALEASDERHPFGRRFQLKTGKEHMFLRTFSGVIDQNGQWTLDVPYAGFTGDPPVHLQAIVEPTIGPWPRIALYSNAVVFGKQ